MLEPAGAPPTALEAGSPSLPTTAHLPVTGLGQTSAGVPGGTAALHSPTRTRLAVSLMDLPGDEMRMQTQHFPGDPNVCLSFVSLWHII